LGTVQSAREACLGPSPIDTVAKADEHPNPCPNFGGPPGLKSQETGSLEMFRTIPTLRITGPLLAHLLKQLIINVVREGDRTPVMIANAYFHGNTLFSS